VYRSSGEITLRGELLAIGGLKEKLLAAARAGVAEVIVPEENRKDTEEIPTEIKKKLKIRFFSDVLSATRYALDKPTKANIRTRSGKSKQKT